MPRPEQKGIPYFPFESDALNDEKFELLHKKWDAVIVDGIWINLNCMIYSNWFFLKWIPRKKKFFALDKVGGNEKLLDEILAGMFEENLFNYELYQKYEILTSKGIQDRYWEATRKRKSVKLVQEYWVFNIPIPQLKNKPEENHSLISRLEKIIFVDETDTKIINQNPFEDVINNFRQGKILDTPNLFQNSEKIINSNNNTVITGINSINIGNNQVNSGKSTQSNNESKSKSKRESNNESERETENSNSGDIIELFPIFSKELPAIKIQLCKKYNISETDFDFCFNKWLVDRKIKNFRIGYQQSVPLTEELVHGDLFKWFSKENFNNHTVNHTVKESKAVYLTPEKLQEHYK